MNDLAASKEYCRFNFVSLLQEPDDVIFLEFVIMLIRVGPKLHFLDRDVLLVLLGLVKFFVHLIEVLTVIHDPANRRSCRRRNLYQVKAPFFGNLQCLLRGHDSELFVFGSDDAHFSSPDSLVDPYVFVDGLDPLKLSEWDKR